MDDETPNTSSGQLLWKKVIAFVLAFVSVPFVITGTFRASGPPHSEVEIPFSLPFAGILILGLLLWRWPPQRSTMKNFGLGLIAGTLAFGLFMGWILFQWGRGLENFD